MIQVVGENIKQTGAGFEKTWSIPELMETYDPLPGEPLSDRNEALRQIVPAAAELYDELSETARLRYDFWKNIQPRRIPEQRYEYATKVADTYRWELVLDPEGLYFQDISGQYGRPNEVYPQLLSDFWFCGPLMPLPDLGTRKWVVAHIRNAFLQVGGPAYNAHFNLFEYPTPLSNPRQWVTGNHKASDFITLRDFGIESGSQNWHDGLVYLSFLSFEQFLCRPDYASHIITPEIRESINDYLSGSGVVAPSSTSSESGNDESKRLFMENGGNIHYIHLDGFGDAYAATWQEEAAWRKELIENYTRRIQKETDGVLLAGMVKTLQYNDAEGIENMLLERVVKAPPKEKQAVAKALWEGFENEKSLEILLSLLENEDTYWRDYVFNSFFRMRNSRTVQQWIVQCLQGDHETYFQKSVDVLRVWGIFGDKKLAETGLLEHLTWADKISGGAEFNTNLEKAIQIITDS